MVRHQPISDERVVLRPTSDGDLATLRVLFCDPTIYVHWGGEPLSDGEIASKYLGKRSPAVECFIVEAGRPVGFVQYHQAESRLEGAMDLVLSGGDRGRGLGASVVLLLRRFVATQLGWSRLTVDPDLSNQSGIEFWRRMGFVPVRVVSDDTGRGPYMLMEWTST
jgi:RimJ/RimL family protein N-acetyltransferase